MAFGTNIAHKIEVENNGDVVAMMDAIGRMIQRGPSVRCSGEKIASEDQDWENGTSTWIFDDGSSLVFSGPHFERLDPQD
jgi:hypothetical protein